ncbi:MAG: fibrobacter succinogenes major paralogous domain-containing protein [Bacteroidota bacterium]|nr:fibrobacter succinogenes major paralogous domain-containing protein [Bacteroidota bacterium]
MKIKVLIITTLFALSGILCLSQESKKIGKAEWTLKNLDVSTFRNGDSIPLVQTTEAWEKAGKDGKPACCIYENKTENGIKYGKLYNWYAVTDKRGLAPKGWHIPDYKEWKALDDKAGGVKIAGKKIKSTTGWSDNGNGDNSTGFTALPAGFRSSTGVFKSIDEYGFWWSSQNENKENGWIYFLYSKDDGSNANSVPKTAGLSVRCVKD